MSPRPISRLAPGTPGTITLWHPASPGVRVTIKPGLRRRLGLRRSAFATLSETLGTYTRSAA